MACFTAVSESLQVDQLTCTAFLDADVNCALPVAPYEDMYQGLV
jgi:hypothetical protein